MKTRTTTRLLLLVLLQLSAVAILASPRPRAGSRPCPCEDPLYEQAERALEHDFRQVTGQRSGGNGASWEASSRLRTIQCAQEAYRERDWDGDGVLQYGTLPELAAADLIPAHLADGHAWGYVYRIELDSTRRWWVGVAEPAHWGCRGHARYSFERSFLAHPWGVTHYTYEDPASLDHSAGIAGLASQMTSY
jgi:hypothetical protein